MFLIIKNTSREEEVGGTGLQPCNRSKNKPVRHNQKTLLIILTSFLLALFTLVCFYVFFLLFTIIITQYAVNGYFCIVYFSF